MQLDYEVVIPSRGTNLAPVLAGLISHAMHKPFALRLVTLRFPTDEPTILLLETLKQLGCYIVIQKQHEGGVGVARSQALWSDTFEVIISLDDDAIIWPDTAFPLLAEKAIEYSYAMPIVRFAQNFLDNPMKGHTEIWEQVEQRDPRVQRALEYQGKDWLRVFELGRNQLTKQLCGVCFAARSRVLKRAYAAICDWPDGLTGEDLMIGKVLREGIVLTGVYAYHFGSYRSGDDWNHAEFTEQFMRYDPELFKEVAKRFWKTGD